MSQNEKQVTEPPTFSDAQGRKWTIKLNYGLIQDVQNHHQFDLTLQKKENPEKLVELMFEDTLLCDILWSCCEEQARRQELSKRDFFSALEGEAIGTGWEALRDAVLFFIQSRSPTRAEALRESIAAAMNVMEKQNEVAIQTIKSMETNETVQEMIRVLEQKTQKEVTSALRSCVSN